MASEQILLEMKQIDKQFPGTHALDHVDFSLQKGEVHALIGQNGSGKSTLMNVLSGGLSMDSGEILRNGKTVHITSPITALEHGIAMIHQELKLYPETQFRDVPVCKLHPFYTADIGFHPYPHAKLEAFAEELKENGLYERILVRPIAGTDEFEILAGHNRTAAAKLAGWTDIPATVMTVNDQRAISIAIATNLLRRQDLTIIERGKAYKALLDARNRCGQRNAAVETFGDNRQRYNARKIVAEFFGVTEYEIRKAVKLAQLIPPLAEIVENGPKKLNLACADLIADYDESAQTAFIEMCQIDGYALNKQTMAFIQAQCPPPTADRQAIYAAWREARAKAAQRTQPLPKKLSFDRKRLAPYLSKFKSDKEIEDLFLEFLRQRAG